MEKRHQMSLIFGASVALGPHEDNCPRDMQHDVMTVWQTLCGQAEHLIVGPQVS